jgi:uncharacterized protein (UPF0261 family)
VIAEKLNAYTAPVSVLIPRKAISVISAAGQPFHDPQADEALFEALAGKLRDDIPIEWWDCEINEVEFAEACANALLKNVAQAASR